MTKLRPSSVENEYFLGDMPGSMQYDKDINEIENCISDDILKEEIDKTYDWKLINHSYENIIRSVPHPKTKFGNLEKWRVIMIMEKNDDLDLNVLWVKIALLNRDTNNIALLTSTNTKTRLNRPIKTLNGQWFVGHYRMSAPLYFWNELINRIKYS